MNLALTILPGGESLRATSVPTLYAGTAQAARRTLDFFMRNPNTRKAYSRAAAQFATWCRTAGIEDLQQPVHVATYFEGLQLAAPLIKLRLAALRMLFDWLVIGQVIPVNPASSVRGPRHSVKNLLAPPAWRRPLPRPGHFGLERR